MPKPRNNRTQTTRVQFNTTKYGPELLVDVERIADIPTFILDKPHSLDFYDITLVTAGRGALLLDGTRYPVQPGTLLFTTPGQVRSWRVSGFDGVCVFFPALFLAEFFNDPLFLERLPFFHARDGRAFVKLGSRRARELHERLMSMRAELRELQSDSVHVLRAALYETLATLTRTYLDTNNTTTRPDPHPVASAYVSMVARHAASRHLVCDYSHELAVSAGYLNSLCLQHLGQNAKAVITAQLTVEARRLLLYSELTVGQIGAALGFCDPSYFTRFFVKNTGRTPLRFRAMRRSR